jgi:hypothetical protein
VRGLVVTLFNKGSYSLRFTHLNIDEHHLLLNKKEKKYSTKLNIQLLKNMRCVLVKESKQTKGKRIKQSGRRSQS